MAKNASQPPYTPEQARARARAGPKTTTSAGRSSSSAGSSKAGKKMFKGGKLSKMTDPKEGKHR
jgi:hypothetical protein